ncbi:hypothetical protein GCM10009596_16030 [Arthrobacter rhombi]
MTKQDRSIDAGFVVLLCFVVGSLISAVLLHLAWSGPIGPFYMVQLLAAWGLNIVLALAVLAFVPGGSGLKGVALIQVVLAFAVVLLEDSSNPPYSLYFGLGLAVWAFRLRDSYFAAASVVALGVVVYNHFYSFGPGEAPAVSYSATAGLALALVLRWMANKKRQRPHAATNGPRLGNN